MNSLAHRQCKTDILRRLRTVRPDSPRYWGRMSAHQMICHLADGCRMANGEKTVSDATGVLQRTIVKWIALYVPLPWPSGILTRPEIDQQVSGTCPGDFAEDVAELEALVERFAAQPHVNRPPHPIFGTMSEAEWLRWAYLHLDHHLRQFGA